MSQYGTKQPTEYKDGRTKQSFKDETDINKILKRAQKSGTMSHLNKYEGHYGDYSNFDFFENQLKLVKGRQVFDALPSEIRSEFNQSPAAFFKYVNEPENKGRLKELLPGLAEPGRQNIEVNGNISADQQTALLEAESPPEEPEAPKTAAAATEAASTEPT